MDLLKNKSYLLFDGAAGTYYSSNANLDICCEEANRKDKEVVLAMHKAYIDAGCNAIKTNTFAANTKSLHVGIKEVCKIIQKAWEIASEATKKSEVLIFADIGPIPEADEVDTIEEYKRIIDQFIALGAKHFLFETFADYEVLIVLSEYIKSKITDSFIITSFAVEQDGHTRMGINYKIIFDALKQIPFIDAFGINCICGPAHMVNLTKKLGIKNEIVSVMPNAGYPSNLGGRTVFVDNPVYFAGKLIELNKNGVKILGGCCGTTPNHIKLSAELLKSQNQKTQKIEVLEQKPKTIPKSYNTFRLKLKNKQKVIAVELDPPFDLGYEFLISGAKQLKESGCDAVSIADSPLAKARIDSVIIAAKIRREVGVTVIPHICCRDKNHIALRATLMGAYIENIRNVVVVTGDPVLNQDKERIKGVFDFNSFGLSKYISSMNKSLFLEDEMFVGGALNVNANHFEVEIVRAREKIRNGVGYLFTQPCYSDQSVENFIRAKKELDAYLFVGLMPLVSYNNAMFINNEVPGISIPDSVVASFENKSRDEAEQIGILNVLKTADTLYDYADGFFIMTPLRRVHVVAKLIAELRRMGI